MINPMDLNGPGGIMPQSPFRKDPGIKQAPRTQPSINGPGGIMPPRPVPGQGDPSGTQYQQMRARRLARGQGGQPFASSPAPGTMNINGPGGIQSPWSAGGGGGGQANINGPGGIQSPWGGGGGGMQINGPGGIQNPNPGLPQPFPSTPFPGMMGGQIGQQQRLPAMNGPVNPFMQQFQQPIQQPQQIPQNPYNPYQNNWNWNQSGQFPGNRFPAY